LFAVPKRGVDGRVDERWEALLAAISQDPDPVQATLERMRELPSYANTPDEELAPDIRRNLALGHQHLRERRLPGPDDDLSPYAITGAQRARQGVTLEDMLVGWSMGLELFHSRVYRYVPPGPDREELLREAIEIATAWHTAGMNAAAAAYRRIELELSWQEQHDAARLVRLVLLGGERPRPEQLQGFGLDPAAAYYAVRARPGNGVDAAAIERWLQPPAGKGARNGIATIVDADVAGFVAELPAGDGLPVAAGVAGPVAVSELPDAFRLASRALETARKLGRRGLVDLQSLGLAPAVVADDDVGSGLLARYVTPLEQQGRGGRVLLETVERYLGHDCQVQATAAELGVHPNTVRYRVARFEQLTGCSLRRNEQLVEAWWALRRRAVG
jgi:PucR C-terminal helix-turn-helix domain